LVNAVPATLEVVVTESCCDRRSSSCISDAEIAAVGSREEGRRLKEIALQCYRKRFRK
jgi:hypothetical protein